MKLYIVRYALPVTLLVCSTLSPTQPTHARNYSPLLEDLNICSFLCPYFGAQCFIPTGYNFSRTSVASGRKGMTAYGMATAQLLFEEGDHLWLLVSSPQFIASRSLHLGSDAADDDAWLLEIPVLRYSSLPTTVTALLNYDDPMEAIRRQNRFVDRQAEAAKAYFLQSLPEEQSAHQHEQQGAGRVVKQVREDHRQPVHRALQTSGRFGSAARRCSGQPRDVGEVFANYFRD